MKNTIDIEDLMMELQSKANFLDAYMHHHDEKLLSADYDFYKHTEDLVAKISEVSRCLEQAETETNKGSSNSGTAVALCSQEQKMKVVVDIDTANASSLLECNSLSLAKKIK